MNFQYLAIILTLILTLGAQAYINHWYNKTRRMANKKGYSGFDTARMILDNNNLENIKIVETGGVLSDHYDPRNKVVRLSKDIYNGTTIAAVSVAAHECGHAIQDKNGYIFLRFRNSIIPLVNFASTAGYFAIIIGIFASALNFIVIGIFLEVIILLFQLVTLPVEFNASSRALKAINSYKILDAKEQQNSKKMLQAAAMTYVAGVATMVLEILRLLAIFNNNRD